MRLQKRPIREVDDGIRGLERRLTHDEISSVFCADPSQLCTERQVRYLSSEVDVGRNCPKGRLY